MNAIIRWFKREPAQLWLGWLAAGLGLLVALGIPGLRTDQVGLIMAVINAVLACVVAWRTRPLTPAVFTGAISAGVALLASYGLHVSDVTLGAINLFVLATLTLLTRGQVTPVTKAPAQPVR